MAACGCIGLAACGCIGVAAGGGDARVAGGGGSIATASPSGNLEGSFAVFDALVLWADGSRISGSSSRATVGAGSCRTAGAKACGESVDASCGRATGSGRELPLLDEK
jgi:hypothetical protein